MSLLQVKSLSAGYGGRSVVHDIELEVHPGEVVALLGPNGAGKTTMMMSFAGELDPHQGEVRCLETKPGDPLFRRARQGLGFVSEERSVFTELTVRQNLQLGSCAVESAVALFPELEALLSRKAGLLSGGEQQMLTLARILGRQPRLLLADELSLGMAPQTAERLLTAVRVAADAGMGALLVEQHVHRVLDVADRFYVVSQGRIRAGGAAAEVRGRTEEIEVHYLGQAEVQLPGPPVGEAVTEERR